MRRPPLSLGVGQGFWTPWRRRDVAASLAVYSCRGSRPGRCLTRGAAPRPRRPATAQRLREGPRGGERTGRVLRDAQKVTQEPPQHSPGIAFLRQCRAAFIMQVTQRPAQRHVTVVAAVVVAAWAASCLPGAHALKLWMDPRGYFQYLMTKECFGEEVALQQEKEAMQYAEYCARQAQGKDPGKPVAPIKQNLIDLKGDHGGISINHTPARRSLVSLPRSPTLEAMICNLRQFRLLTDDNQVNFTVIEDRLEAMKIDPQLKLDLLESVTLCRPSSLASSQREESSDRAALLSAMLAVARYQGCIGTKTHSICKEFVHGRVASKLHL